jgi:hypothetical protein
MVIIDRTNRNKLANAEGSASGDGPDDVPSQKIVDFESSRKAWEKGALDLSSFLRSMCVGKVWQGDPSGSVGPCGGSFRGL